jgi:hypothetical protein
MVFLFKLQKLAINQTIIAHVRAETLHNNIHKLSVSHSSPGKLAKPANTTNDPLPSNTTPVKWNPGNQY